MLEDFSWEFALLLVWKLAAKVSCQLPRKRVPLYQVVQNQRNCRPYKSHQLQGNRFASTSQQQVWCHQFGSSDNAVEAVVMVPEQAHLLRTPWQAQRQRYTRGDVFQYMVYYSLMDASFIFFWFTDVPSFYLDLAGLVCFKCWYVCNALFLLWRRGYHFSMCFPWWFSRCLGRPLIIGVFVLKAWRNLCFIPKRLNKHYFSWNKHISSENRPNPKRKLHLPYLPSIFGCELLVSGSVKGP